MKVVQDLLPSDYKEQLQEVLFSKQFPWYWSDRTVIETSDVKQNIFQLQHIFFAREKVNSDYFKLIEPMFSYIEKSTGMEVKGIYRIKANLLPKQVCNEDDIAKTIHTDIIDDIYDLTSFIYYLHDVDGDINTYDKDYKIINSYSPKENSLVYFSSSMLHGTRPPMESKRRVCINFVLKTHD
jgi:hypothetical protein